MQRHTRTWKQILFCNFSVTLFRNSLDEGLKGSSASSTFSGLKRSCFNSDKLPGGPIETSAFSQALQVSAYVFMSSYCEEDVSVCPTLSNSDLIVLSSVNKNVLCSLKQKNITETLKHTMLFELSASKSPTFPWFWLFSFPNQEELTCSWQLWIAQNQMPIW